VQRRRLAPVRARRDPLQAGVRRTHRASARPQRFGSRPPASDGLDHRELTASRWLPRDPSCGETVSTRTRAHRGGRVLSLTHRVRIAIVLVTLSVAACGSETERFVSSTPTAAATVALTAAPAGTATPTRTAASAGTVVRPDTPAPSPTRTAAAATTPPATATTTARPSATPTPSFAASLPPMPALPSLPSGASVVVNAS